MIFFKEIIINNKKIQKVNSKTDAINEESKDIKEIINKLKQQPLNKNNLLLSNDNKDKIVKYIEDIESNNKTIKSLTNYSVSLMDIKNDLNDNLNKIYKLSNENKYLKEELNNKDELLDVAEKKINKLQLEIFSLEDKLRQWRLRFKKLVDYLRNKVCRLFGNKNQDIYKEIVEDLHDNDFLTNDDYNKIHMKPVVQEKASPKKERNKDDDFVL